MENFPLQKSKLTTPSIDRSILLGCYDGGSGHDRSFPAVSLMAA